ncbi:Protein mono-ADP-ribosyltransferase parp4 [Phlyctochytrium planicorne]|nr:Protein mono-ADP-ribosyltransferase parp4 [Phlyctochytrium planicorne]
MLENETQQTTMTPLLKLSFEKMRDDLLKVQDEPSQYLTCWDNPRLAQLFPELGYVAACKVIEEGNPPDEYDTISKLHAFYDKQEYEYRKMFAEDRSNPQLDDPNVLMQNPFPSNITLSYNRRDLSKEEQDLYFVFKDALTKGSEQVMVSSIAEYQQNWDELTSGLFKYVNFDNVFVAGGAVVAALQPSVKKATDENYFNSDIDVFIYGLKLEQVRAKVIEIYEAIRKAATNNPNYASEIEALVQDPSYLSQLEFDETDHLLVRNLRSLILVGEYPKRQIQIVFRLYKSPAEVLMGFDIDSCCFGYNGKSVLALPRALRAVTRRYNLVDLTRRSASYELRLFKYAKRGFAVACPNVDVSKLKQVGKINTGVGLSKLLSLETQMLLPDYFKETFGQDKVRLDKAEIIQADRAIEVSISDGPDDRYTHYQAVKIPYGDNWDLERICTFLRSFRSKAANAFYYGPLEGLDTSETDEDHQRQKKSVIVKKNKIIQCLDELIPHYLQTGIKWLKFEDCWMTENPGRQLLTGSFEPVETSWESWVKDAYTEKLRSYEVRNY